jgi:hypothetical protein
LSPGKEFPLGTEYGGCAGPKAGWKLWKVGTTLALAGIGTRFFGNYTGCSILALIVEINNTDLSPIIIKVI